MSACWPLQMPPTPKAVLVSLADNANDHGGCWPSISKVCERTCFGKTAVIQAIAWLETHGALTADKSNGRHTSYTITPHKYEQPVRETNRSVSRTGTPREPKPVRLPDNRCASRTEPVREADTNRQEPSLKATVKSNRQGSKDLFPLPDWLPANAWKDWADYRKAGKSPMTEKAKELSIRKLAELRALGHDPVRVIENAIEMGWRGLYPPNARGSPVNGKPSASANFRNTTYTGTALDDLPADLRPDPAG